VQEYTHEIFEAILVSLFISKKKGENGKILKRERKRR